jgi:hypothetical protein
VLVNLAISFTWRNLRLMAYGFTPEACRKRLGEAFSRNRHCGQRGHAALGNLVSAAGRSRRALSAICPGRLELRDGAVFAHLLKKVAASLWGRAGRIKQDQ